MKIDSPDVLVTGLKPSDDGKAIVVRLWGGSGREAKATLTWSEPAPRNVWVSDTSEKPITKLAGPVTVPSWGIVTLRAELR